MKKRLIPLVTAAALALSVAGSAAGVDNETYKKPCADILMGSGGTIADPTGSTTNFDLNFSLRTPSRCGGVLYTLYVYDDEADCSAGSPEVTLTQRGTTDVNAEGQGIVAFFGDNVDDDGTVWVVATSAQGNATYDRAPDVGCLDFDTSFPGKGMN